MPFLLICSTCSVYICVRYVLACNILLAQLRRLILNPKRFLFNIAANDVAILEDDCSGYVGPESYEHLARIEWLERSKIRKWQNEVFLRLPASRLISFSMLQNLQDIGLLV